MPFSTNWRSSRSWPSIEAELAESRRLLIAFSSFSRTAICCTSASSGPPRAIPSAKRSISPSSCSFRRRRTPRSFDMLESAARRLSAKFRHGVIDHLWPKQLALQAPQQSFLQNVAADIEIVSVGATVEVIRARVLFVNVCPAASANDQVRAALAAFQHSAEKIWASQCTGEKAAPPSLRRFLAEEIQPCLHAFPQFANSPDTIANSGRCVRIHSLSSRNLLRHHGEISCESFYYELPRRVR